MDFINYYIRDNNVEGTDIEVQLQDLDTLDDPPGDTVNVILEASDQMAIMDTPELDDDKTSPIKGRRLNVGFNSDDDNDVDIFSDGDDGRFRVRLGIGSGPDTIPFLGSLVLDDNSEAFQPKPNLVKLSSGDGLGSLKGIELKESDGDIAIGHFRIIDYITLCLGHLVPDQEIHVVFNLYEEDTDPTTSHAFFDTFLNALTFETDVDKRDDCYTVLQKIMYAFGCFITYDNDGWWIINWDEYDAPGGVTTHRVANFTSEGILSNYTYNDLTKVVAYDEAAEYIGYRLSNDNGVKRFQRRANLVTHTFKLEQPKEVPCNSSFTRGTVDDDVLPLKTFDPECWTLRRGFPGFYATTTVEMKIGVRYDTNEYETERFLYLTPASSGVDDPPEYAESEAIEVQEKDKFELSVNWRTETVIVSAFGGPISLMRVRLHGDDGSDWLLGNEDISDPSTPLKWWDTSNFTVNTLAGDVDIDTTLIEEQEWQPINLGESPPIPVNGKLYILLEQFNQTSSSDDNVAVNYADLRFTYIPYINGSYHTITAQEHKVTGDNDSRKKVEQEMFISDSPKPLLKGAMKKFSGGNYVLTENWNNYITPATLPDSRLGKHIVFQWWNQFRKTRTVIETDIQGLRDNNDDTPSLIHRWKFYHDEQDEKYFMLTSFRNMDFYLCGWNGVFVEMSDSDGDRDYDDDWTFKYIQD